MQYKQDKSSVQERMCSVNQAHHQFKGGCAVSVSRSSNFGTGGTTQKHFPMNESLLLLIYPVKTAAYGRLKKSINYEIVKVIFNSNIRHIIYIRKFENILGQIPF